MTQSIKNIFFSKVLLKSMFIDLCLFEIALLLLRTAHRALQ